MLHGKGLGRHQGHLLAVYLEHSVGSQSHCPPCPSPPGEGHLLDTRAQGWVRASFPGVSIRPICLPTLLVTVARPGSLPVPYNQKRPDLARGPLRPLGIHKECLGAENPLVRKPHASHSGRCLLGVCWKILGGVTDWAQKSWDHTVRKSFPSQVSWNPLRASAGARRSSACQ